MSRIKRSKWILVPFLPRRHLAPWSAHHRLLLSSHTFRGSSYPITGGYCKEYSGKRAKGIALDDTWLLRLDTDFSKIKWEKRKKIGYAPSVRSGATMTNWTAKGMGVLFGGVYDDDKDEETLESEFYNDL
jgi:hypothetical protein